MSKRPYYKRFPSDWLAGVAGLRHGEIAERMQVSVSSVRQYLARAMQHCLAAW